MQDINLQINKELFTKWRVEMADITMENFAKEIGVDPGNFSKMLDGIIPTPKHVLEKVLARTYLPHGKILLPVVQEERE